MESYDVVIVGSGFGGAIPALRLAEAGLTVRVLERGRRIEAKDFKFSWDLRYLQSLVELHASDDLLSYQRYAKIFGGGSVAFSGAMLRAPSEVFTHEEQGSRMWPEGLDRSLFNPYYDKVEQMMDVRQARWDEVPRSGGVFAKMLDAMGLTCDRGRFPFVDCVQCGFCEAGCQFGRKRSLTYNYIPAAEALGAEFTADTDVRRIEPSDGGYLVFTRDRFGVEEEIWGKRVIIAGGAIGSPALLLRSADALPSLSPAVGKNLNNNGDLPWFWMLPEGGFDDFKYYKGRNNAVMISYAFWEEHKITIHTGCGPPAILGAVEVRRESGPGSLTVGLENKRLMHSIYPNRVIGAQAIGLVPASGEITLDSGGSPVVSLEMTPELQAYYDRLFVIARDIAKANGAELLKVTTDGVPHGDAHPLGTCRMGEDPTTSVVDPFGEVHGHPGLFVSDGSTLPTGTGVNPSLTVGANAERIAESMVASS